MSIQIQSYGHSAFHLRGPEHSVFIDPHGPMPGLPVRFEYPLIRGVTADLLLITHEHPDHNNAGAIENPGQVIRSAAGTHRSSIGGVVSIAPEHDAVAGTVLGANTIVVFSPVGGNDATLDGQAAARLVHELGPSWAIPMHYQTEATDFLEPVAVFTMAMGGAERAGRTIELSAAARSPGAMRCTALASPAIPQLAA
jgi:L-ascorbate metabolism protein UlaG (beta-lactamase superfamily)